jgi:hypothetical protein
MLNLSTEELAHLHEILQYMVEELEDAKETMTEDRATLTTFFLFDETMQDVIIRIQRTKDIDRKVIDELSEQSSL